MNADTSANGPRRRRATATILSALALLSTASHRSAAESPARPRQPVRIGMDALHQSGGVPPGWQLSPGEGDADRGRIAFAGLGCHMCHAVRGAALRRRSARRVARAATPKASPSAECEAPAAPRKMRFRLDKISPDHLV